MQRKLIVLAVLALAACHKKSATPAPDAPAVTATTAPAAPATNATTAPAAPATPAAPAFSIDRVPLSNAPLGEFPYFGLPPHYKTQGAPTRHDLGRFPFWTGSTLREVEGRIYMAAIEGEKDGDYSAYELKRNLEALFAQAGAVKIVEGKIPSEPLKALSDTERSEVSAGSGDWYNDPVETWVIHRPDKVIWIHLSQNTAIAGLTVVEAKPFVPTATLLPASALKADIAAHGKAVVHVNFASDQAAILPDSQPQVAAIVALLKGDGALRLAVNGYTDETGGDAHNLALSDARAHAVTAALVGAGIDAARLQAKGYGTANPVAPNGDEAGKAANRRVELIRL